MKKNVFLKKCRNSGGKHGHKKYHKKGQKTTGFHHKANKDEHHKEHKYYDSEEKKGDHKKYGSDHEYHDHKKGEHKKGEKKGEGYDEGHKGKLLTKPAMKIVQKKTIFGEKEQKQNK